MFPMYVDIVQPFANAKIPPNKIEQNLSGLLNLLPDETDELLQRVDQPLEESTCAETVRGVNHDEYHSFYGLIMHLGYIGQKIFTV